MTTPAQKVAGYDRLLKIAEIEVVRAKLDVSCHKHGAAHRLRDAERERDTLRRLYEDACLVAYAPPVGGKAKVRGALADPFAFDSLAPDFGTDDDGAPR